MNRERNTDTVRKPRGRKRCALLILSLLWLGFYLLFRDNRAVMTAICVGFVRPFHAVSARFWAVLPFSAAELLCWLAAAAALAMVVQLLILLLRRRGEWQALLRWALTLAALVSLTAALFTLLWGVYYCSDGFAQQSGLRDEPVSTEALRNVTEKFIGLCNEYGEQVQRDEEGLFTLDRREVFAVSAGLYENASRVLPLSDEPAVRCKGVSRPLSYLMSATGFTGFFCPYTGESNVNTHMPDLMLPSTIAHELAHQRGVEREDYANFTAVVASLESGRADYAYSGAVMGYIYLGNALYSADYETWHTLYASISPAVRADLNAHNAYWQQFDGKTEEVSEQLYEQLLESVGDERGMASYGACVDLLVEWYG